VAQSSLLPPSARRLPAMPLIDSEEPNDWQAALSSYPRALEALASKKQDPSKLKGLDEWFQDPKKAAAQKAALDRATLGRIVEWKLSRGTFRPGLLQKAQSNDEATVKEAYRQARELILAEEESATVADDGSVSQSLLEAAAKAIKAMDKSLFGVGPATASAVLARSFPHAVAFMSDEAMLGCGLFASKSALKYDMKTFKRFNEVVQGRARKLNAKTGRQDWTGESVARALWSEHMLAKFGASSSSPAGGGAVRTKPAAATSSSSPARGVKRPIDKA